MIANCSTYQERYEKLKNTIVKYREAYENHTDVLERAMEDIDNNEVEDFQDIAPCTQHNDDQDESEGQKPSEFFGCFNPSKRKHSEYNILDDIGMYPRSNSDEELIPVQCMQTKAFRELVRSLNKEQMEFFYHVLHSVKTNKEQFTIFLSGGAGVGKTTVTHA